MNTLHMRVDITGFSYSDPSFIEMLKPVFAGEYNIPLRIKCPRILDIGANIGSFAIWAIHRWPGATVYAYEPLPEIYEWLERNVEATNSAGIIPIDFGVGKPGPRMYYPGKNNIGEGGFYNGVHGVLDKAIELYVRDPLILPEANIIKMDTEGCEYEILQPLLKAGRSFDGIMFEYHRETDRFLLEGLLKKDYVLTGAQVYHYERGVQCYIHRQHKR